MLHAIKVHFQDVILFSANLRNAFSVFTKTILLRIVPSTQGCFAIGIECTAIARAREEHDSYFSLRRNCAGTPGLHPYQKLTSAFRILAYGISVDGTDEYCRLPKSTALDNLRTFVRAVIEVFGGCWRFPGMVGSIDCMHWQWKNCLTAHKGFFVGHNRVPTIILEAVTSQDLWIWHSFFGLPGSHNDINVLHRSPVFANLAEAHAPEVNYTINGRNYNMGVTLQMSYIRDGPHS